MDATLRDVDSKIIFGEAKKRPEIYSKAINYLINNSSILTSDFIVNALNEKRYFLLLAISETLIKKYGEMLRVFLEFLEKHPTYTQILGLSHLKLYKMLLRGLAKPITIPKNVNIFQIEECLKYGVHEARGLDILKCRELYIDKLSGSKNDINKALSIALPLSLKPSIIKLSRDYVDSYWVTLWPYTLVYSNREAKLKWLQYNSLVKEYNVDKLDVDGGNISFISLDNAVAMVFKKNLKSVAIVSSTSTEPSVVIGDAICYNGIDSIYSIEFSDGNIHIRKYDEYGNLAYSKLIKVLALSDVKTVDCSSTSDMGVIFNAATKQGSLIVAINDSSINTQRFKETITAIATLPLGFNILYTDHDIYIAKAFKDSLKVMGPYNKPHIGNPLFIGAVQNLGIVAITGNKIYELDALGNIVSSENLDISKGYIHAKVIHTYLFPLIVLINNGAVSEILLYFENNLTKLDPKALGIESKVLDLAYNNGVLCFNTIDYTSICVSPLYISWLILNRLKNIRKYTFKEIFNIYDKLKSFEDPIYIGEVETYFNNQILEEVMHRDYIAKTMLAKVTRKDVSTPLNRILRKSLRIVNSDSYLDLVLTEYQDSVRDCNLAIASNTVYKILSYSNTDEIDLNAVKAEAIAINELMNIAKANVKRYIARAMARLLGAFEVLNTDPQNLRHVLGDFPKEPRSILLKSLVLEALSNIAIVSNIAIDALKMLGYDVLSLRNEMMEIIRACSKLFSEATHVADVIQKQYEHLLSNAQFNELTEYLNNSKKLIELVENLDNKLKEYGIDLSVNQEFRDEVAKCLNTELSTIQLNYCKDNLLSLFECNVKLRNMLESIYNKIKDSKCINRDVVDGVIRGLKLCRDAVKAIDVLEEKISRLLLIENNLNELVKGVETLQPLGDIIKDDINKVYEAIRKLDEAHANELLSNLRNKFRVLAEVNRYLKGFLFLRDREPFSHIRSDIEEIVKRLIDDLKSRSIKIDDIRKAYSNIVKIVERATHVNEVVKNIEEVIGILVSDLEELKQHKVFILRQYLNIAITQGFETSFKELNRLQDIFNKIRTELSYFVNNINKIREISEVVRLYKLFESLNRIILNIKSLYRDLDMKSLSLYIERCQELLNKIKMYNEKVKNLYTELNSLTTFLEGLDKDVATQVIEYLSSSFKTYIDTRSNFVLDDFPTKLAAISKSKSLIYEINKKVKDLKERREVLKSRFCKAFIDSNIERTLKSLSMLRFDEVYNYLDIASKVIAKIMIYRVRVYNIDEIISILEANGIDVSKVTLSKDPLEKIDEICKLGSIENIIIYNPKLVVKSLLIANKINDGIQIAKLAYIAARKLGATDIADVLDSIKPGNLSDVVLQLLSSIGIDILKLEKNNTAFHVTLLKIFEDYIPYANSVSCKDREKIGELYHIFCVREDILQTIALAALWCSEENIKCYNALGVLGGFHIKILRSYIDELSKILETKFRDYDLGTIKYVVDVFWSNRPSKVHEELDKLLNIAIEKRSRIYDIFKIYRSYIGRDSAIDLLKISREIYNMIKDEDYYRERLQKGLELGALGELSMDTSSEIVLRMINNMEFPVEVKDIKLRNFIVSEKIVRIEPGNYQDFKVFLPRLDIDEKILEKGRELNIDIQFSVRIPEIQENRYSTIYSRVAIPVRYYGPRSTLIGYIEILRAQILDILLPTNLGEAMLGVGGNNIVLLGISKEDGKRVVIKVPGLVADLGAMPTVSFSILSKCKNYADRCVEATSSCRGRVARVRRIELNPPYAVEEYVDGETLRKKLNEHRQLSKDEALSIALSVGEAIKCLHSSGIFHNDIRPENVMISRGSVMLIDACIDEVWDILKHHLGPQIKAESLIGSRVDESYTHPLLLEKLKEGSITDDDRAKLDVFQLGLLIYEMLLGYNPINKLRRGALKMLPQGFEDLENILMKVCSPSRLPELSITEFLEELRKLI